jgi:hypothetical protein
MKRKLLVMVGIGIACCSLSGCFYLAIGGVGALGGFSVSPDTVEGITSSNESTIFDTAIEICSVMGTILEQQQDAGMIVAKINGAKVTINILPVGMVGKDNFKLIVKARKINLPRISLAQDVFVKIMSKLKSY